MTKITPNFCKISVTKPSSNPLLIVDFIKFHLIYYGRYINASSLEANFISIFQLETLLLKYYNVSDFLIKLLFRIIHISNNDGDSNVDYQELITIKPSLELLL